MSEASALNVGRREANAVGRDSEVNADSRRTPCLIRRIGGGKGAWGSLVVE